MRNNQVLKLKIEDEPFFSLVFKKGSLLLELLIVIGLFAIITPLTAQIIVSGLNVNKHSSEQAIVFNLAEETLKAAENISFARWQDIYDKDKGEPNYYYPEKVAGAWTIKDGSETVEVNGLEYSRYFTINDVCRDNSTKEIISGEGIPPCPSGAFLDPSTQEISATIAWSGGTTTKEIYLTRWRNRICKQSDWGTINVGPNACPSSFYGEALDIDAASVPGSLILLAE
ncbi:MAG: hypothetical protein WC545_03225 [Patescibacteria group bacterium]